MSKKKINPLMPMDQHLSNILSDDEVKDFKAMKTELQDSWVKKQMFRTETEMRISVLNDLKHPTPASKYWQAVREQNVFFEQMVFLSFDFRKNEIEIKKLERDIAEEKDDLEKELLLVKLDEKKFARADMLLTAKDRMRELRLWSKLKHEIVRSDPNFDKENVNTHQQDSLPKRLFKTWQFFDKAGDADGAKNIAAQIMTAQRLAKEGKIKTNLMKDKIKDDKNNK
tara:strand:+ start:1880 stop:2557 length:678 start_codon:yes stop_codon:yes gene_type:complete